MRLSVKQYALALHELLQEGDKEKILTHFRAYLVQRGEAEKFVPVLQGVIDLEEALHDVERLTVFTKHVIDTKQRAVLEKKIAILYPGKQLDLTHVLDESLIGGFRVQGKDTSYDQTLAHTLNQFSQTLKS